MSAADIIRTGSPKVPISSQIVAAFTNRPSTPPKSRTDSAPTGMQTYEDKASEVKGNCEWAEAQQSRHVRRIFRCECTPLKQNPHNPWGRCHTDQSGGCANQSKQRRPLKRDAADPTCVPRVAREKTGSVARVAVSATTPLSNPTSLAAYPIEWIAPSPRPAAKN